MKNQHKDFLNESSVTLRDAERLIGDDLCIGGGYYQFDWTSNRLLLDRASYDFG